MNNIFPKISRPTEADVLTKECRINLKDKEQKLSFKQCIDEYEMWFDLESAAIRYLVMEFTIEMIKLQKIYDKNPTEDGATVLTMESEAVKKWIGSERVKFTKLDKILVEKFYKMIEEYQDPTNKSWNVSTDTETRKVLWK